MNLAAQYPSVQDLDFGADIYDGLGGMISWELCKNSNDFTLFQTLLKTGKFDINGRFNNERESIMLQLIANYRRLKDLIPNMQRLIEMGADVNVQDAKGLSPLHDAVKKVKMMLLSFCSIMAQI